MRATGMRPLTCRVRIMVTRAQEGGLLGGRQLVDGLQ
jgi:hypothetical protein